MKFTGENVLAAPVDKAWDALLDPAVLVRTIPGCERLEATGDNAYAMTVTAGVASIKGTYAGSCALRDLVEHESLVMKLDGAGAPGTIGATVNVRFTPEGSSTRISYDADAVVGGMIGGVAQGVGGALYERMVYDDAGQLLNASFMDFLMPYVTEVPTSIEIDHLETPSPLNPLGIKGAGEAGVIPSAAVFAAAIEDAEGFPITAMPISPSELYALRLAHADDPTELEETS
jgi:carbon monoxide dehydrogenase subunit G